MGYIALTLASSLFPLTNANINLNVPVQLKWW